MTASRLLAKKKSDAANNSDKTYSAIGQPAASPPTADNNGDGNQQRQIELFFFFICLSTAFRSFEAGIISAMMPAIQLDLSIDYAEEGMIAASPDYGISPGSLLAIFVFSYLPPTKAYDVLLVVCFGTSAAMIVCASFPCETALILSRTVGGLLFAQASVFYPIWIDRKGLRNSRTLWLGLMNVSMLFGILAGYIVGGAARTSDLGIDITWVHLYFLGAFLMFCCGLLLLIAFDRSLVSVLNNGQEESGHRQAKIETLWLLLSSIPFVLAVSITAFISGAVVFALYFITQVCIARGIDDEEAVLAVAAVFVSAPAPGMLFGSWVVAKLGGYTDHVVTFSVAMFSAILVSCAALLFPLSSSSGSNIPFLIGCWIFFFAGAMSAPPLNGVAVSVVPRASFVASGLQFCLANAAKILIPMVGGIVIDRIGLVDGFNLIIIICCAIFVLLSAVGLAYGTRSKNSNNETNNNSNVYDQLI